MPNTNSQTIGRRKEASARVTLKPGNGTVQVNGRTMENYFPRETHRLHLSEPFRATNTQGTFDVVANVRGGGMTGQASAIRLGIARALAAGNEAFKLTLRKDGFLTRDSRGRERKKYGQKGARKRFQWTKR